MSRDSSFTLQNWLHNRAFVEYVGLKSIEFDGFRFHLATCPQGLWLDIGAWDEV
jgi:hypothetical protein